MSFGVKPIANSNMSKHTLDLDLCDPASRAHFDSLLSSIDMFLDGYRPGARSRPGYGPAQFTELARSRNKGIIYISESCFGALPPSSTEPADSELRRRSLQPGWQQIANCVTGLAWTWNS